MSILDLFCSIDDFRQAFAPRWQQELLTSGGRHRRRAGVMHPSEIMTIVVAFPQSPSRTFKAFYTEQVQPHWRSEFPTLVSYERFVALLPTILVPLTAYLHTQLGSCTGLSFIDSTKLTVCHRARTRRNRVFAGRARLGKSSTGWFLGFKLHLVVNDRGELVAFCLTPGQVDDRAPVPRLTTRLFGKLFGDKGYISQPLAEHLFTQQGLQLITHLRKNMHNRLLAWSDKILLRTRAIIETIHDHLKNGSQIEHTRHRSPTNFLVNLVAGLIAYCHQPKKPSLHLGPRALPAA